MRGADRVVVNSEFTKGVVNGVWHGLGGDRGIGIVYPCVNTKKDSEQKGEVVEDEMLREMPLWGGNKVILSINRFERKKDVGLAIKAFAGLKVVERTGSRLVVAGTLFSRGFQVDRTDYLQVATIAEWQRTFHTIQNLLFKRKTLAFEQRQRKISLLL